MLGLSIGIHHGLSFVRAAASSEVDVLGRAAQLPWRYAAGLAALQRALDVTCEPVALTTPEGGRARLLRVARAALLGQNCLSALQ